MPTSVAGLLRAFRSPYATIADGLKNGTLMKIRILSLARVARTHHVTRVTTAVAVAAALIAGCTAVYKNGDACEQTMRSKLAETSSEKLDITHTGAGIDGTRVVVEGSIEHVLSASEVAAAAAASAAASAALAANAPDRGAARASAASGAKAAAKTGVPHDALASASAASAASVSAASSASGGQVASQTSGKKPKTKLVPAAVECTFSGNSLLAFHWLAPAQLASPPTQASDATE